MSSDVRPRYPDPIAHIYLGFPILPENTTLDTEDPNPAAEGQVKVRALDGFLFEKGGKFVYPRAAYPREWWQGVTAFGYIAALSGDYRYFIWAGQWDETYDGKHIEVVILGNLTGITKERDVYWRNGQEDILWLDTELGYSYALLEPSEEYDRGSWAAVTASWANISDPAHASDPAFLKVDRHDPRPGWWDHDGDEAWLVLQGRRRPKWLTEGLPRRPEPVMACGRSRERSPPITLDSHSSDDGDPEITCLGYKAAPSVTRKGCTVSQSGGRPAGKTRASAKPSHSQESTAADQAFGSSPDENSPPPSKSNKKADAPRKTGRRYPSAQATAKPRKGDIRRANLKRRVVSGPLEPRQRQKQKTEEAIYVGSSDEEGHAPNELASESEGQARLRTNEDQCMPSNPGENGAPHPSSSTAIVSQSEHMGDGRQAKHLEERSQEVSVDESPRSKAAVDDRIQATIKRLFPHA